MDNEDVRVGFEDFGADWVWRLACGMLAVWLSPGLTSAEPWGQVCRHTSPRVGRVDRTRCRGLSRWFAGQVVKPYQLN